MALEEVIWNNQLKHYVAVERREKPAVVVEALGAPVRVVYMISQRDKSIPYKFMPEGANVYFWGASINEGTYQDSAPLQYGKLIKVLDNSSNILENPGVR